MSIQESKEIVGTLVTQGQAFELLDFKPQTKFNVPLWLREHVFAFLILDKYGYANTILVSRGGFYILPALEIVTKFVKFVVPDEEVAEENKPVLI